MTTDFPHIVYIVSDEHRGQAMSHAGDPNVQTPSMDRLASEGSGFQRAYANCPICTPSRGTMWSGRHAHAGPVSGFFDVFKASAPSTATIMRELGYHTAYFGKWHCGIVRNQNPPEVRNHADEYKGASFRTPEYHRAGFQDWYGFECLNQPFSSYYYQNDEINPRKIDGYQTDGLAEMVMEYLEEYDRDKPLFLVLSVEPPHFPLEVPDKWRRFDPQQLQVRPNFTEDSEARQNLATYYAMIENLDWNIGRVMDQVQTLSEFDNTLTVYFSDHGDFMGSHDRQERKEHPHEESVRIPALFHWPEQLPAQGNIDGLFSLVDLLPTTLGLLNADIPSHVQGTDFSPALRGESFSGPDTVLLEMVNNPRWRLDFLDWRAVVTEKWKYAFYETGEEMLFDLEDDPFEMHNLADSSPQQKEEMQKLLLQELDASREPYFHVLIEDGVEPEGPVTDVSTITEAGASSGAD
ncbi:MAG: sulfatase [Planctomycetota bacterium]